MKPILFAILAIVLYGVQNALIDLKLRQYSTASILVGFYLILLPLGLVLLAYQKLSGQPLAIPSGEGAKALIAVAMMFFIADFLYIAAFTHGGNVAMITILAVLVPVVAVLFKFFWTKELPTNYHYTGFVLAALAIICVAAGNAKKPPLSEKPASAEITKP